ncbi:GtrA family protein [Vibrio fluvialis]|uniref:GtrA family protein n=1 Tax=Vibrio fluvialis TaxID=676 RepID=UPI00192AD4E1|nr:GtrA family protein [Vibrio fluvialis]MBY7847283.1 GtrA family protein [Vibrio fluvialis]MBY8082961.1 GtrA family protein [Vibrio fluvialis]
MNRLFFKYKQIIIFAIIGAINTVLHAVTLVSCVELLTIDSTLANAIAFMAANIFSYFANSKITFKSVVSLKRYISFFSASILSLLLTLTISYVSNFYGFHYLIGFGFIIVLVPAISFIIMKFFVFSEQRL